MTITVQSQFHKKRPANKPLLLVAAVCVATLAGCSSKPAYNSTTGKGGSVTTTQVITNANGVPNRYQVKQGDTVSRIAQRYGLDWREIGRMNNLNGSYSIFTGQWLTLWTGNAGTVRTQTTPARQTAPVTQQPPRQTAAPTPAAPAPVASTAPTNIAPTNAAAPFAGGSSGVMQFRYPVGNNNPVVRRFGTATVAGSTVTSNGMWFSGKDGDVVQASRAGTIIHADGNRDGATIVIQHTDGFTSSYIHIKDATVRSGDSVQVGQRIASMRNQAGGAALFEFRIARNNVYVDPLTVLK